VTERNPKSPRDSGRGAPPQEAEKAFDPAHLGRHTMPLELRLELMTAELPRLADEELYHSPHATASATADAAPSDVSTVEVSQPQRRKTRRRIGVSVLIGVGVLAAMVGVVLLRAPRMGPQRLSPTSASLRGSTFQRQSPSDSGAAAPPAATAHGQQR